MTQRLDGFGNLLLGQIQHGPATTVGAAVSHYIIKFCTAADYASSSAAQGCAKYEGAAETLGYVGRRQCEPSFFSPGGNITQRRTFDTHIKEPFSKGDAGHISEKTDASPCGATAY